jgi:hypothetical protein
VIFNISNTQEAVAAPNLTLRLNPGISQTKTDLISLLTDYINMNLIRTSVKTFNFCTYGMSWRALTAAPLSLACIVPMNSLLAQGRPDQPN